MAYDPRAQQAFVARNNYGPIPLGPQTQAPPTTVIPYRPPVRSSGGSASDLVAQYNAQHPSSGGGGGWWHDITNAIGKTAQNAAGFGNLAMSIPAGLIGLGAGVAKEFFIDPVHATADPAYNAKVMSAGGDPATAAKYFPISTMAAQSVNQTGNDILHPSRYVQAWNRGEIAPMVINDAANLSMAAGFAGKALTAGSNAAAMSAEQAALAGDAARASSRVALAEHLSQGAGAAEKVAALGGSIASSPISIPRAGLRGLGTLGRAGYEAALAGDLGGVAQSAAERAQIRFPQTLTAVGQFWKATARQGHFSANREAAAVVREMMQAAKDTGASTVEQGAALALVNKVGSLDQWIQADAARVGMNLTAEELRKFYVSADLPEQKYNADIAQVVNDYHAGTLPPEAIARIDAAVAAVNPLLDKLENRAVGGRGLTHPMTDAQLGNGAIDRYVVKALQEHGVDPREIANMLQYRARNVSWDAIEQVNPDVLGPILNDPSVYPSAWRPVLRNANIMNAAAQTTVHGDHLIMALRSIPDFAQLDPQLVADMAQQGITEQTWQAARRLKAGDLKALADGTLSDARKIKLGLSTSTSLGFGIPNRPSQLLAQGFEQPRYIPGGPSEVAQQRRFRMPLEPTNVGTYGLQGVGSQLQRGVGETQAYSFRTLADKAAGTVRATELNHALLTFVKNTELVKSARDILTDPVLTQIEQEARTAADAIARTPQSRAEQFAIEYGTRVMDALKQQGYEPLLGDRTNPMPGDFNPTVKVNVANGDLMPANAPDTIVLPIGLKAQMGQRTMPRFATPPLEYLRFINTHFKSAVLRFSIRWQLGDIVGGMFMGWSGGGVNPLELYNGMQRLKRLTPDAAQATIGHGMFQDAGLAFDEAQWKNLGVDSVGQSRARRVWNAPFKLNETIVRINRQGYLLAKLEKLLNQEGMSIDSIHTLPDGWQNPKVMKLADQAVADANKIMGTFDELTPFEQRYLKNVWPFYTWMRHITTLAVRTAVDHPARMVWTLRLGQIGADKNQLNQLPWMQGSIGLPDWAVPDWIAPGPTRLSLSALNPYQDVFGKPLFTRAGMFEGMSPGIKIPAAFFGLGMRGGPHTLTAPYGTSSLGPVPALYTAMQSFPITREAMNLAPSTPASKHGVGWLGMGWGPHPRYESGANIVNKHGVPIATTPRAQVPFRLVSLPMPVSQSVLDAQAKSAAKKANKGKKKKAIVLG